MQELMICNKASECKNKMNCQHQYPHEHYNSCEMACLAVGGNEEAECIEVIDSVKAEPAKC